MPTAIGTRMKVEVTEEVYAAHIPVCCDYQGMKAHVNGLMLCWGLMSALEAGREMDCRGCELATRGHWLEIKPGNEQQHRSGDCDDKDKGGMR